MVTREAPVDWPVFHPFVIVGEETCELLTPGDGEADVEEEEEEGNIEGHPGVLLAGQVMAD